MSDLAGQSILNSICLGDCSNERRTTVGGRTGGNSWSFSIKTKKDSPDLPNSDRAEVEFEKAECGLTCNCF